MLAITFNNKKNLFNFSDLFYIIRNIEMSSKKDIKIIIRRALK